MSNSELDRVIVRPVDEYNQKLVAYVHPPNWVNPQPADSYDLVVIGAGTAGLVVAAGAAGLGLGLKVALIEKHLMGGDCLNVGCVPSKTIIRSSRVVGEIWNGKNLGINIPSQIDIDFPAVMARMRRIRADISHHDSAERFASLGVDVFLGSGKFASSDIVEVAGKTLKFKKAVIATGARATKPAIIGIEQAGYLTNETVFSLIQRPEKLAVIGGGPIGCELAQAFRRLGSEVVLIHSGSHLLNKEDNDAAQVVQQTLIKEGIRLVLNAKVEEVVTVTEGKRLYFSTNGYRDSVTVDEILVGAGRSPNVEGLNLEAVGVKYDKRRGVEVNDYLQTTNPKIYAAGDICMDWKFTHAADAAARIVIKNTLFSPFGLGRSKLSSLVMPWVTYTDPEIAHVGLYESQDVETIKIPFSSVDRAIADAQEDGFLKIHHKKGSDEIVGATIVATHAGEMISEITTAIVNKIGLNKLSNVIHPYPTQAEAIKKAADTYRRTLLTPRTKKLLGFLTKFS
ncbi:FAD-dependent pyridine nucleotide-disulphide oxidoreductase [Trichormus variabilis ATCC 29413]|uniref:FAD-dependent pyridine nucleotide-disulphide oxidoreductase n=2 Tax=Anabaena variabilis TaxID=264691 RepID=Q3MAD8_TRIV2|nr:MULTISPECIES: mercuric reductase [Nostocaceae]ABA22048.1 FAD-dependent pyridine nucleotide-disulphide oxidoreductase [Trichormus variabilis ATCC 29413]MBC1213690.1 mercuric reductase [Trichormus variabilis ARAD]MBC1254020.1 mercuric reductase [Trichormus variabilis V5]MBC1266923.1 mercuric reductase [Trichormus variabilis FSR]MBC1303265.1 mercuric reductase [Trichormus variabilis N2B]